MRSDGLTQKEVGRILGLSAQRIHQLEGGTHKGAGFVEHARAS
ncbi:helix-turn-helix domain-containing protein [Leifsonia sp. McL0608]